MTDLRRAALKCARTAALLAAIGSTGCSVSDTPPGGSHPVPDGSAELPQILPATCAGQPDGKLVLYVLAEAARPWTALCASGLTYLPLPHTGSGENYSQYKAGGYSPGQDVVTRYTAVRIDPSALVVDVSDQTFSTSSGSLRGPGVQVSTMPYGVAMDCISKQTATGSANIDLRDTPFAIRNSVFAAGGVQTASTVSISSDARVAVLAGGGECGWVAAGVYAGAPVNRSGSFQLPLRYQQ